MKRPEFQLDKEMGTWAALIVVLIVTLWLWVKGVRAQNLEKSKASEIKVKAVVVYPVKSCAGVSVMEAELDAQCGLSMDRLWMVVDARGAFMSQRRAPKLALVKPNLPKDRSQPLKLKAPGMPDLEVPVFAGSTIRARCWTDICEAKDQGSQAAEWFSEFLGVPGLRLVRMPEKTRRYCDTKYAPRQTTCGFSDGFPLLVVSQASLDALNAKMHVKLPMNRFRPNIVIEGCGPFAEDSFKRFAIGSEAFLAVKPCARCKMPTIDQKTAVPAGETDSKARQDSDDEGGGPNKGVEPTATLKKFRTGKHLGFPEPSWADEVFFGQNACHVPLVPHLLDKYVFRFSASTIAVGDGLVRLD